jgi:hypothetical protein
VYHTSVKTFGLNPIVNECEFSGVDDEEFDIINFADQSELMAPDTYEAVDMENDSHKLSADEKIIYTMLKNGQDVGTIAKEFKMTKKKLMQLYAGINLYHDEQNA